MIIITEDLGPNFKYEEFARSIFDNCVRGGDPWKRYTKQDFYDNFVGTVNEVGKRGLSTILVKMILDHSGSDEVQNIIELEEQAWSSSTQQEIITIIDKAIVIAGRLGYK